MLAGTAAPAAAQSWPGDSGPNGDMLGLTMRQYERLAPPPVEAERRAERVVPGISAMDLAPRGSVEVGSPVIGRAAAPPASGSQAQRQTRTAPAAVRASGSRERELKRELAAREREIRALRHQVRRGRG